MSATLPPYSTQPAERCTIKPNRHRNAAVAHRIVVAVVVVVCHLVNNTIFILVRLPTPRRNSCSAHFVQRRRRMPVPPGAPEPFPSPPSIHLPHFRPLRLMLGNTATSTFCVSPALSRTTQTRVLRARWWCGCGPHCSFGVVSACFCPVVI